MIDVFNDFLALFKEMKYSTLYKILELDFVRMCFGYAGDAKKNESYNNKNNKYLYQLIKDEINKS